MGLSLVWGSGRPSHWDSVDRGLVPQFWKDPPREGPSHQHCPHSGMLESGGLVSPDLEPRRTPSLGDSQDQLCSAESVLCLRRRGRDVGGADGCVTRGARTPFPSPLCGHHPPPGNQLSGDLLMRVSCVLISLG